MTSAIMQMISQYSCKTSSDYENALKEIIQEIALLGLWRAKFFEHAAFYGGSALRILYQLDRYSEDLDFSLLQPDDSFSLDPYLKAVESELSGFGFQVTVETRAKRVQSPIESAFIKAQTQLHLLKIQVPAEVVARVHRQSLMTVKVEVDTDPPAGFFTEAKILLQPIPFSVVTYQKPDLFAGKIHAILQRAWKARVKGRDFYDFVWYIAGNVPCRLSHLEQRLRQTGGWTEPRPMQRTDLVEALERRFAALDVQAAKQDIQPFVRDPESYALWSPEFFASLLPRLLVSD